MWRTVFALSVIVMFAFGEYSPWYQQRASIEYSPWYEQLGSEPIIQFNLTTSYTGNGSVSPSGTTAQDSGSAVNISATPETHWSFSEWQVTNGSADIADTLDATTTVTLHTAASVRAVFVIDSFTTTVNSGAHAPITGGGVLRPYGSFDTLVMAPAAGYGGRLAGRPMVIYPNRDTMIVEVLKDSTVTSVAYFIPTDARTVAISPASLTIDTGGTRQFSATYYDTIGRIADPQPSTTWVATFGSINGSGLYSAGADTGRGIVRGYNGAIADTAPVVVRFRSSASPTSLPWSKWEFNRGWTIKSRHR
jgi:hypothetical protein